MSLLTALASTLLIGAGARGESSTSVTPVEQLADDLRTATGVPGVAVSVRHGSTETDVVQGPAGDARALSPDTPVLIGSVAKSWTAAVVLDLVDQGRLTLDDRVSDVLSWFPHDDVRIRDLLQHTSGYDAGAGLRHADLGRTGADAVTDVAREAVAEPRDAEPGEFAYSDLNYLVLGAVVEETTQRPFADVLLNSVVEPLRLTETALSTGEIDSLGVPPGHRRWFGSWHTYDLPFDESGVPYGYVAASLDDLSTFADAVANDRVPGAEEATSAQVDTGVDGADAPTWYGFGWRGGTWHDEPYVEHTGATPSSFAHVVLLPEQDVRVVVLATGYAEASAGQFAAAAPQLALTTAGLEPVPEAGAELASAASDPVLSLTPFVVATIAGIGLLVAALGLLRGARRRSTAVTVVLVCLAVALVGWMAPSLLGYSGAQVRLWVPDLGWSLTAVSLLFSISALAWLRWAVRPRTSTPGSSTGAG